MTAPVVVIDNGTGYTKMGYAGNEEPTYIIPTTYAEPIQAKKARGETFDELNFCIGQEAEQSDRRVMAVTHPLKAGIVEDWDKMEKVWQHCIYKYLRIEPHEHGFLLTEPPANPPENREYTAEIMFETFGAKQLNIAVQGVMALTAAWTSRKAEKLGLKGVDSGIVVDSGAGVTHVVPIADGFVIGNAIRHIPLAGRTINEYIMKKLKQRNTGIPQEQLSRVAQRVKEQHCYICRDIAAEFNKFDSNPSEHMKIHEEFDLKGQPYQFEVGYEQFLGPEIFFSPDIFSNEHTKPLPQVIDEVVMSCPMEVRKKLYRNIVLSGGTTMFRKFDSRLQLDMRTIVDARLQEYMSRYKDKTRKIEYEVNVVSHERQRYAVWYGGSVFGASPAYQQKAITKAQYDEEGASVCRKNAMFSV